MVIMDNSTELRQVSSGGGAASSISSHGHGHLRSQVMVIFEINQEVVLLTNC